MKRAHNLLILLLIFTILFLTVFFIRSRLSMIQHKKTKVPNEFYKTHILGGFSIDTPESASMAASEGVQVVFDYNPPPTGSDKLGQKLQSFQMKVVDGYISSYVTGYECHRTKTIKPPPAGQDPYCHDDIYPYLTDENVLLAAIAGHLKQVKGNPLIIGYWVLDDWASWDAGGARQLLIKIHQLIQRYTPGRPAICGFGGFLGSGHQYGWGDWAAGNFSPQGCDLVGFYIYSPDIPNTTPAVSPDAYDWSMAALLPAMFVSLERRGWIITKEPLIGIGQAFGGPISNTDSYWVIPTAKNIETQSISFCKHGATGLTFYSWDDSGFGPTTQTPTNSSEIEMGIQKGIAACKQYWSTHPQPSHDGPHLYGSIDTPRGN